MRRRTSRIRRETMSFYRMKTIYPGKQKAGRTSGEAWGDPLVHLSATGQAPSRTPTNATRRHRSPKRDHRCSSHADDPRVEYRRYTNAGRWDAGSVCIKLRSHRSRAAKPTRAHSLGTARATLVGNKRGFAYRLRFRAIIVSLENRETRFLNSPIFLIL